MKAERVLTSFFAGLRVLAPSRLEVACAPLAAGRDLVAVLLTAGCFASPAGFPSVRLSGLQREGSDVVGSAP